MKKLKLYSVLLGLFDGEGGGTGAASGTAVAGGTNASTDAGNMIASTQRSTSGAKPQAEVPAQTPSVAGETNQKSLEERRKAYRELMNGEYKDLYQEDTQGLINRRFKETKDLREAHSKQKAVIDILAQKYNISDGNVEKIREALEKDDDLWSEMAADAGFDDVSKYRDYVKLQNETKALREADKQRREAQEQAQKAAQERKFVQEKMTKWNTEAEGLKATYPEFDISRESQNKEFMSALTFYDRAQVQNPVERAYKATHHDEIVSGAVEKARAETEKNVVDNIRAKGKRPAENGTQNNSSFTAGVDWSNLSKSQRAELLRRAERGEIVTPYK
jgi:hypothetical protein